MLTYRLKAEVSALTIATQLAAQQSVDSEIVKNERNRGFQRYICDQYVEIETSASNHLVITYEREPYEQKSR